ncbi:ribonuclease P protein component [Candidatus Uhrbacteria bacterium CG_4_9_14_3_um_filter_50_9]|uniref:Ribonuclease P protein component n=1 Tax=Candidatus Uhrbacteria bacterium CG_4_9_14_3_um_filter_50_9 TaxID=1975035 RepID=A0A2M7XCN0_9BACT|nr:MAG: ribonuclease P protein component [Candidatus Uhrbacteria bacterium CG_4_9_14_3_um_filter_50_9]
MFPREHRLRHEKDIKALFANGKSVFGIYVGLKVRKNNLPLSRFAVVVGTKVSKRAVVRNRLKRRVRAIAHERLRSITSGYDVLFLVRKEALEATFEELETELVKTLKKAKLLCV